MITNIYENEPKTPYITMSCWMVFILTLTSLNDVWVWVKSGMSGSVYEDQNQPQIMTRKYIKTPSSLEEMWIMPLDSVETNFSFHWFLRLCFLHSSNAHFHLKNSIYSLSFAVLSVVYFCLSNFHIELQERKVQTINSMLFCVRSLTFISIVYRKIR